MRFLCFAKKKKIPSGHKWTAADVVETQQESLKIEVPWTGWLQFLKVPLFCFPLDLNRQAEGIWCLTALLRTAGHFFLVFTQPLSQGLSPFLLRLGSRLLRAFSQVVVFKCNASAQTQEEESCLWETQFILVDQGFLPFVKINRLR